MHAYNRKIHKEINVQKKTLIAREWKGGSEATLNTSCLSELLKSFLRKKAVTYIMKQTAKNRIKALKILLKKLCNFEICRFFFRKKKAINLKEKIKNYYETRAYLSGDSINKVKTSYALRE